jgi:sec-independent protein translocase protein TatC
MNFEGTDSLVSHLLELRSRLLRAIVGVLLVFVALLPFQNKLYTLVATPLTRSLAPGAHMVAIDITSTFFVPMKLAFFAALMLTMPWVLYQVWAFVAPGLYQHEKRYARPLLAAATLLFYAGCAFMYFIMLPVMFAYLGAGVPEGVVRMPDLGHYLDFLLVMFLAGGVSFEVPVAVVIAVILGWVTPQQLSAWRGYVVVAIFIIAAVLTPPDAVSQLMLALPMCALYEVGLLCARLMQRQGKPATSP